MRTSRGWWIATVLAGATLAACNGGTTMDAGPDGTSMMGDGGGMDGTNMMGDGSPTDGPRTDARDAGGPPPDVMHYTDPCAASAVVDATMTMPNAMGVVHVVSDNWGAPMSTVLPTMTMNCPLPLNMSTMMTSKGYQRAFRYRMRTTAALRATTATTDTPDSLDTVLMITTTCSPAGPVLACNDDTPMSSMAPGSPQSTATTPRAIPMGTEVFIVVGSFQPELMGSTSQGAFGLDITEVPLTPVGMACTETTVCAEGSHCLPVVGMPTMFTCQMDGAVGTVCRMMDPRCDTGLQCSATMPTANGICRTPLMADAACDPTGRVNFCQTMPTAQYCVQETATGGTCTPGTMEMEPNQPNAMGQMVTLAGTGATHHLAINGALPTGDMEDCFRFTLAAPSSVVIQTGDGLGGCPAMTDTILTLYSIPATGSPMMLVQDDDGGAGLCSLINGSATPAMGGVNNLAAGTYAACVTSYMMMPITSYVLTIGTGAPVM